MSFGAKMLIKDSANPASDSKLVNYVWNELALHKLQHINF